jgi:hypothetical protein
MLLAVACAGPAQRMPCECAPHKRSVKIPVGANAQRTGGAFRILLVGGANHAACHGGEAPRVNPGAPVDHWVGFGWWGGGGLLCNLSCWQLGVCPACPRTKPAPPKLIDGTVFPPHSLPLPSRAPDMCAMSCATPCTCSRPRWPPCWSDRPPLAPRSPSHPCLGYLEGAQVHVSRAKHACGRVCDYVFVCQSG